LKISSPRFKRLVKASGHSTAIRYFGCTINDMPDEKFVSRLTKDLTVGASPERREVQSVLAKLKAVERFLNQDDAAFLRAEFLSYFER
jgi:hypothetical protein